MSRDSIIVQRGVVGAGEDDDTYLLSANLLDANAQIKISDTLGSSTIHLVGDHAVTSSRVAANTLLLSLDNGVEVTVFDADTVSYVLGGSPYDPSQPTQIFNYQDFAREVLGAAPVADVVLTGQAVAISQDGTFLPDTTDSSGDTTVFPDDNGYSIELGTLGITQTVDNPELIFRGTTTDIIELDLAASPDAIQVGDQAIKLLLNGKPVVPDNQRVNAVDLAGSGLSVTTGDDGSLLQLSRSDDTVTGGAGFDEVSYEALVAAGVVVNGGGDAVTVGDLTIGSGKATGALASSQQLVGQDTFNGVERITGSRYDDYLVAGDDVSQLSAGAGNDTLIAAAGSTLKGGAGSDLFVVAVGDVENPIVLEDFDVTNDRIQLLSDGSYQLQHQFSHDLTERSAVVEAIKAAPGLNHAAIPFALDGQNWLYFRGDGGGESGLDGTLLRFDSDALSQLDSLRKVMQFDTTMPDALFQPAPLPDSRTVILLTGMSTADDLVTLTGFDPSAGDQIQLLDGADRTPLSPDKVISSLGDLALYGRLDSAITSPLASIADVERTLTLTDAGLAERAGHRLKVQYDDQIFNYTLSASSTAHGVLTNLSEFWTESIRLNSGKTLDLLVSSHNGTSTLTVPSAAGWGKVVIECEVPTTDSNTLADAITRAFELTAGDGSELITGGVATAFSLLGQNYLVYDNPNSDSPGELDTNDLLIAMSATSVSDSLFAATPVVDPATLLI